VANLIGDVNKVSSFTEKYVHSSRNNIWFNLTFLNSWARNNSFEGFFVAGSDSPIKADRSTLKRRASTGMMISPNLMLFMSPRTKITASSSLHRPWYLRSPKSVLIYFSYHTLDEWWQTKLLFNGRCVPMAAK
jgi:hypothetical protein